MARSRLHDTHTPLCRPEVPPETSFATVDEGLAEQRQRRFESFSVTEIRECLEFEPPGKAIALLCRAAKRNPCRALKNYARKNRTGHYRCRARSVPPKRNTAATSTS